MIDDKMQKIVELIDSCSIFRVFSNKNALRYKEYEDKIIVFSSRSSFNRSKMIIRVNLENNLLDIVWENILIRELINLQRLKNRMIISAEEKDDFIIQDSEKHYDIEIRNVSFSSFDEILQIMK